MEQKSAGDDAAEWLFALALVDDGPRIAERHLELLGIQSLDLQPLNHHEVETHDLLDALLHVEQTKFVAVNLVFLFLQEHF